MQLGFDKAHQKITRRRKGGRGSGLGELTKIWWFSFNIYTMPEASDFKFVCQSPSLNHTQRKVGMALG